MSVPDVPGFDPDPKTPEKRAPDGACDCHMHIFGPAERYPWSPARGYTPPDALLGDYRRLQVRLGLERTVVVQPSVYGTDNACTRDAVVALGAEGRGVAVLSPEVDEATPARPGRFRGRKLLASERCAAERGHASLDLARR